jgi:hypothetical protein
MPSEYRVIDANGIVLAHVYGQPDGAIAQQDRSPTMGVGSTMSTSTSAGKKISLQDLYPHAG